VITPSNWLDLTACITEVDALRYTPAGLPALNLRLEHASELIEAGQPRQVKAGVKAVAFGVLAERLAKRFGAALGAGTVRAMQSAVLNLR